MGYPISQYVKEDDSECSTYQYVKSDSSGHSTCPYVKRDGSICGKGCWRIKGCSLHWKLYDRNIAKFPCGICRKLTISGTGYCPKHAKRVYFRNWYEREKAQRIEADE
ncbi:3023_t:CDS:1 [Cetraspora pellucida]|uniref:3023_t:CDS:1 n=1 Tax=Cetraspora pellucida TaxID=1433469 RepID=A0ACA9LVY5_9GLOM|nr:3023_t:CDS:1 [Cetraspora pellucida]